MFIYDYTLRNLMAPSFIEMGDHLGVSKVTAFDHCQQLIEKGLAAKAPHYARALRLTKKGKRLVGEPLANLKGAWAAANPEQRAEFTAWAKAQGDADGKP